MRKIGKTDQVETVDEIGQLLSHYKAVVELCEGGIIQLRFPVTPKQKEEIKSNQSQIDALYGDFENHPDPIIKMNRQTRYVVRSLVCNPQFWRVTTVAQQMNEWEWDQNKQEKPLYGKVKTRKRAGEPFTIIFENDTFANKFFKALMKPGYFNKHRMSRN